MDGLMKSKFFSLLTSGILFLPLNFILLKIAIYYYQFFDSLFSFSYSDYPGSIDLFYPVILSGIVTGLLIALVIKKYQSFLFLIILPILYILTPMFFLSSTIQDVRFIILSLVFLVTYILSIKAFTKKYQANKKKGNLSLKIIQFAVLGLIIILVIMFFYSLIVYVMDILRPFTYDSTLLSILKWVLLPLSALVATFYDLFTNDNFDLFLTMFFYPFVFAPLIILFGLVCIWDDLKEI